MALPPQFTSPGQKAAGRPNPPEDKSGTVSVDKALSVLESKVNTSRGHAALKTLRAELESGDSGKKDNQDSPGARAAAMFAKNNQ